MERRKKNYEEVEENTFESEQGPIDELDRVQNYQKIVMKKSVKQFTAHELYKTTIHSVESTPSPSREDSAYYTRSSMSKSSSMHSNDRFPSEECLSFTSPSTSKIHTSKVHQDKPHEWYNQYTTQAFQHLSPLASRTNTSISYSRNEFDTHIAQMRGNIKCIWIVYELNIGKLLEYYFYFHDFLKKKLICKINFCKEFAKVFFIVCFE